MNFRPTEQKPDKSIYYMIPFIHILGKMNLYCYKADQWYLGKSETWLKRTKENFWGDGIVYFDCGFCFMSVYKFIKT